MPEQTRAQQQQMLEQQAFIWIRLFMNSTLTDLHPDCKRWLESYAVLCKVGSVDKAEVGIPAELKILKDSL
jgi:uncharacterized metal-binding protein